MAQTASTTTVSTTTTTSAAVTTTATESSTTTTVAEESTSTEVEDEPTATVPDETVATHLLIQTTTTIANDWLIVVPKLTPDQLMLNCIDQPETACVGIHGEEGGMCVWHTGLNQCLVADRSEWREIEDPLLKSSLSQCNAKMIQECKGPVEPEEKFTVGVDAEDLIPMVCAWDPWEKVCISVALEDVETEVELPEFPEAPEAEEPLEAEEPAEAPEAPSILKLENEYNQDSQESSHSSIYGYMGVFFIGAILGVCFGNYFVSHKDWKNQEPVLLEGFDLENGRTSDAFSF